jgi:hypothetical protein
MNSKTKCVSKLKDNSCLLTIGELPAIVAADDFFASGFSLDNNPLIYQCMEEWLKEKAKSNQTINIVNYCKLPHVSAHTPSNAICKRVKA